MIGSCTLLSKSFIILFTNLIGYRPVKIYFWFRFCHDKHLSWFSMNDIGVHLLNFYCTFLILHYYCTLRFSFVPFCFFFTKLKKNHGKQLKLGIFWRLVDDVIGRRLKNTHDSLFENSNSYHEKIKFTIETNQQQSLDTRIFLKTHIITTDLYCKANKFPAH